MLSGIIIDPKLETYDQQLSKLSSPVSKRHNTRTAVWGCVLYGTMKEG